MTELRLGNQRSSPGHQLELIGESQTASTLARRRLDSCRTPAIPPLRRAEDVDQILLGFIDDRPLTRVCVSAMFEEHAPEFSIFRFSGTDELLSGDTTSYENLDVIVLNVDAADIVSDYSDDIARLAKAFADIPIIVLSDRTDHDSVSEAFRCGARGFVPTSTSPDVAVQALRLVCAGGAYAPADMVMDALDALGSRAKEPFVPDIDESICESLTRRERDVLKILQRGVSNKVIARELDMQECTVKVHVRHIMKKLKATNRTQAALMAYKVCQVG